MRYNENRLNNTCAACTCTCSSRLHVYGVLLQISTTSMHMYSLYDWDYFLIIHVHEVSNIQCGMDFLAQFLMFFIFPWVESML